jgi:eukaryotic-like serine/threonine-protein kinase
MAHPKSGGSIVHIGHRNPLQNEDSPVQAIATQALQAANEPSVPKLDPQAVDKAARELAAYVGPVAKVLAQRAELQSNDIDSLYQTLALELHSFADREAFLRTRPLDREASELLRRRSHGASAAGQPTAVISGVSLAAAVLEQATRELTPYLGPISKLLVKRAQAKALDREHLYHLLARQLGSAADRSAFLAAAGVSGPLPEGPG